MPAGMRSKGKRTTFYYQLTLWLLIIWLPLVLLLIISCFYSINVSNRKLAESNGRMAAYYAQHIDKNLEMADSYLLGLVANNPDFSDLSAAQGELDAYLARYALQNSYENTLNAQEHLAALFLYSMENHIFLSRFAEGLYSYEEREMLRATIRALCERGDDFYGSNWTPYQMDGRWYLLRIMNKSNAYAVALVDFRILLSQELLNTSGATALIYATRDTLWPMNFGDFIADEQIELQNTRHEYYFSGRQHRYMILGRPVQRAGLAVFLVFSESGYWDGLTAVQIILLVVSLLTVAIVPATMVQLKRLLIFPMRDLIETMEAIKGGNLGIQVSTEYRALEFEQVKDVFNSMISDIGLLKIKAYEQEIDRQKMEMQYLQLQLRPHFFLNCLKSLYATAQQQKTEQLQEMILAVSGYMRYLFLDNLETVPLESELRFVRDYIHIQQLSSALSPEYEEIIAPQAMRCRIPAFSIEPFVENAVKHETSPDRRLAITVRIDLLKSEEGNFLDISVLDNGNGFPEPMLEILNSPPGSVYNGRHVGLSNLKHRLQRLYLGRATTAFYNTETGSVSEILLPMDMVLEEGQRDERTHSG